MGEGTLRKHGRVFEKIAEKLQWGKTHKGGQPSEWSDIGPSVGCIDCSPLSLDPSLWQEASSKMPVIDPTVYPLVRFPGLQMLQGMFHY